ncbi:MAG: hypothetical protein HKN67_06880, partial [Saprospiraceae bacterium]|nr:hypothetical protein [Saprospiraceae bacterium]
MKYILLTILTLLSDCMQISTPSDNYDKLWEQVEKFEKQNLPKSGYDVVLEIYEKAIADNRSDQLIKSLIYSSKLTSQFEDRDPASYIEYFEDQINKISDQDASRICYSIIGELYQQYGMMNINRFSQRTEYDEAKASEIAGLSLEEIQERSIAYYERSLEGNSNKDIDDFKIILSESKKRNTVAAGNINEFLLYRALTHYINDQSFISLAGHITSLSDPALFSPLEEFRKMVLTVTDERDYSWKALTLFQRALNEVHKDEQREMINLERIEYVYQNSTINGKQEFYLNALKNLIEKDPDSKAAQMAHCKIIDYYLQQGEYYRSSFDKKYEQNFSKAYQWIQKAKKNFPKGEYADVVAIQQLKLNKRYCQLEMEQVVPAKNDFLAYVQYRNVDHLFFRVTKLNDKQWKEFNSKKNSDSKVNFLKKLESFRSWEIDLPGTGDFNYHGTEFPVEGLSYGKYILLASNTKEFEYGENKFVNLAIFHVSDLSYIYNSRAPVTELYVIDRTSGKAVKDAAIDVFEQEYNYKKRLNEWKKIASLKSGRNGYASYDKKDKNFSFRITNKDDVLDLRQGHYNLEERKDKERAQVHLFTDRAIYRPGQTIFFKALLTVNDSDDIPHIVPGEEVKLDFRDANWQLVESKKLKTNEFGSLSGHFMAPDGALTGQVTIEARASNGFSSRSIRVEEYKRPKIFSKLDTLLSPYVLGDTIDINGTVESFSGLKVENATIKYRIEKIEYVPWYRYSYADFSRPHLNQYSEFIISGDTRSDSEGKFNFSFPTISDSKEHAYFNYRIHCDVTDITGESTTVSKQISLSAKPFFFSASIPGNAFEGEVGPVKISTSNCEGAEIRAIVNLQVYKLDHPDNPFRSKYWKISDRHYLAENEYESRFPLDKDASS